MDLSLSAILTSSGKDLASIFFIAWLRCIFIVASRCDYQSRQERHDQERRGVKSAAWNLSNIRDFNQRLCHQQLVLDGIGTPGVLENKNGSTLAVGPSEVFGALPCKINLTPDAIPGLPKPPAFGVRPIFNR
jgi:hypothetical protein